MIAIMIILLLIGLIIYGVFRFISSALEMLEKEDAIMKKYYGRKPICDNERCIWRVELQRKGIL